MGHIHELFDFTASAFIVHDNRILLLHHKKLDKWLQPGGHIELDEGPIEGLYREIEEETGLTEQDLEIVETVKDRRPLGMDGTNLVLPLPFDFNIHGFQDTSHSHIDLCYLMKSSTEKLRNESEKAHAIGWFTLREITQKHQAGEVLDETLSLAKLALKLI